MDIDEIKQLQINVSDCYDNIRYSIQDLESVEELKDALLPALKTFQEHMEANGNDDITNSVDQYTTLVENAFESMAILENHTLNILSVIESKLGM